MLVSKSYGYTLVELMVVVAIIGIIATVGYPSYQGIVASSSRAVAQADLMALASAMERHRASNFSYEGAALSKADTGKPAIFNSYSPASEPQADKKYDLTIDTVSAKGQSYLLKAAPVKGTSVEKTGALYFYSDGRRAWDQNKNGSLEMSEYCWNC